MDPIHLNKILYDIVLLIIMFVAFIIFKYVVVPFQTGFYCDDYSINMEFKESTVSNSVLIVLILPVPFLFMIITEIFRTAYMKFKHSKLSLHNKYRIIIKKDRIIHLNEQFGNLLINFGAYSFGLLCNLIITLIGKKTIGRLRPNFLSVCKPSINPYKELCNTQVTGRTFLIPGFHFDCLEIDMNKINESRKSFPSGHSSSSFYAMIFLILYVHKFWNKRNLGFVPQFFQFLMFTTAWYVALSRVTDNKHHPTDVLAGSILGTLLAGFTFYYLNLFYRRYNFRLKYDASNDGLKKIDFVESSNLRNSNGIKQV
ncbi:phosphatidate phosphatase [Brachionus plicatilis]|uniref:Phosphatidate phosphatase n=1 Tax=Brachionus plicatilis TaxID=10195 RepID=A0A3M7Q975_BRAPC|nr:phosphatidate phosphatase [Brachionus plicatilis]